MHEESSGGNRDAQHSLFDEPFPHSALSAPLAIDPRMASMNFSISQGFDVNSAAAAHDVKPNRLHLDHLGSSHSGDTEGRYNQSAESMH